jgi:ABC-type antimicrobial peptide transport system permease subunit
VLGSVFARVAGQIALGLVVGIVAAAVIDRGSGGELLGGRGAVLLPAFGLMMILVALLAAVGPARRGLRIQPMEALREQ